MGNIPLIVDDVDGNIKGYMLYLEDLSNEEQKVLDKAAGHYINSYANNEKDLAVELILLATGRFTDSDDEEIYHMFHFMFGEEIDICRWKDKWTFAEIDLKNNMNLSGYKQLVRIITVGI